MGLHLMRTHGHGTAVLRAHHAHVSMAHVSHGGPRVAHHPPTHLRLHLRPHHLGVHHAALHHHITIARPALGAHLCSAGIHLTHVARHGPIVIPLWAPGVAWHGLSFVHVVGILGAILWNHLIVVIARLAATKVARRHHGFHLLLLLTQAWVTMGMTAVLLTTTTTATVLVVGMEVLLVGGHVGMHGIAMALHGMAIHHVGMAIGHHLVRRHIGCGASRGHERGIPPWGPLHHGDSPLGPLHTVRVASSALLVHVAVRELRHTRLAPQHDVTITGEPVRKKNHTVINDKHISYQYSLGYLLIYPPQIATVMRPI